MAGDDAEDRIDPLTRLSIRHGSDKYGGHRYTPAYHALQRRLMYEPLRMMERANRGARCAALSRRLEALPP